MRARASPISTELRAWTGGGRAAIIGTLFERSLDKGERKLIGAHYTSAADIRLVIEPVDRRATVRQHFGGGEKQLWRRCRTRPSRQNRKGPRRSKSRCKTSWLPGLTELSKVRVLRPGLRQRELPLCLAASLLDLWLEARTFAGASMGLPWILTGDGFSASAIWHRDGFLCA